MFVFFLIFGILNTKFNWPLLPECVARIPVSLWGSGGWAVFARRCPTLRNRLQPSATVHKCPRKVAMAVPMVSFDFWSFPALHSFISRGHRGTLWHVKIFHDVSKVVLCGRRSTLKTSDVVLRGRRSTSDVSCCVFSANRIVSAARSGDKVQIPWQDWHFVTGDENRRKPRTKRRFWGRLGGSENS